MNKKLGKFKKEIQGKKAVVMGLGLQGGGVDSALFLAKLGAKVIVTDLKNEKELKLSLERLKEFKNIKFVLGKHREEDFEDAYLVVKSPAIPWNNRFVKKAEKTGAKVYTSVSLFFELTPTQNIIGITGTRGKTTTTYMVYKVIKSFKDKVFLLGNIPNSYTLNSLFEIKKSSWVVMELSSWQLSGLHRIKKSPRYAIFTNFYPDHFNYYNGEEDYLYDKSAIFLYQKKDDFLILNKRFSWILKKFRPASHIVFFSRNDFKQDLKIPGDHNKENASAVLKLSEILGFEKDKVLEILTNFKGVPYRLEKIGVYKDVIFINDSTSTTPIACCVAIESFKGEKIYLIMGGNSKNLPFDNLLEKLSYVEKIFLLKGSFTDEIYPYLIKKYKEKVHTEIFQDLKKAVLKAFEFAKTTGGIILFSPSATSFSLFRNEFERAKVFNKIVKEVIQNEKEKYNFNSKKDKI